MDEFLRLLQAEAERTTYTEVAFRIGVPEGTLRSWLASDRNSAKRSPRGDAVLRALQAYPALVASVVPEGTTIADFASSLQGIAS